MTDLESAPDEGAEPYEAAEPDAPSDSPVAAALAELDTLAERDLAEHADVYQRIHGQLHDALGSIDDA